MNPYAGQWSLTVTFETHGRPQIRREITVSDSFDSLRPGEIDAVLLDRARAEFRSFLRSMGEADSFFDRLGYPVARWEGLDTAEEPIPRCLVCGEETTHNRDSSWFGHVHRFGPQDHEFRSDR